MKHILFIAYQFPPLNMGGSARPAKFVKHLMKFGVRPTVVTLDQKDYYKVYPNSKTDSNLLEENSENYNLLEVSSENLIQDTKNSFKKFLKIFFNIYGSREKTYWVKNYNESIDKYLSQNKVDGIVVTAPPFGIISLALETAKKYSIPLIIDMRDPWTLWNNKPYSNYISYRLTKSKENSFFKYASAIIGTSKVTIADFKRIHPNIESNKFYYIPNGYEKNINFEPIKFIPKNKIVIGYVGSFYYTPESREAIFKKWWKKKGHRKLQYTPRKEDWLYRSPYYVFKTFKAFFESYPKYRDIVEFHFVGKKEDWLVEMIDEFKLTKQVKLRGWMTRDKSLDFQRNCDFLLITSSKVLNGKDYSIAGKTFEYFEAKRPILSFVTEGAQKELLKDSNLSTFIDLENIETGVDQIYELFRNEKIYNPNTEFINSFQIERLSEDLAKVIKEGIQKAKK